MMPMEANLMALTWDSIADGIIATDTQGVIMDINTAALELIDIEWHEAVNQPLDKILSLHDETTDISLNGFWEKTLKEGKKVNLPRNTKLLGRNQDYYLAAKFSPIQRLGQPPQGVVVVFRDITQQKMHEEQLHLYRMALEQSPFSVVMTDIDNQIVYVNREFIELTGYGMEEVMGRDPGFLKSGSTPEKTYQRMWETITRDDVWQGEFYNRKKNGRYYWEKAIVAPITSPGGIINYYLAIKEDVTDQKAMEEELRRTREQADRNLKKSQYYMEQLENARRAANAANKAKSEFLANMSHEIRTPLNGIIGMIELTAATDLTREQQDNLDIIRICGNNLFSVINNVLDFSKIESGKMEIDRVDFDVQEWFMQSLLVHQAQATKKGIDLVAVLDPHIPNCLLGDAKLLQQVMNNLIGNAVKFTETGCVKVTMDYEGEEGGILWVKIQVKDTGMGIPKDELPRLFRSFTQLDGSITRRFGGTGLGLAISRQLVEMMDGTIRAASVEGEGSTFTVTLPFEQAMQQVDSLPENERSFMAASDIGQKWTILVVEDDPINQTVIRSLLKLKGYQIHCANDGKEAVSAWESLRPDLILMDIQMPAMDGIQATGAIREREKGQPSRTPIIALTAHAIHGDRERFLASGMDEYVSKPVEMDRLYHAINRLLDPPEEVGLKPLKQKRYTEPNNYLPVEAEQLMAKAVEGFIPDMFSLLDRLHQQLFEEDVDQIERLAHQVKNRAVTVGELDIKNQAFKIELAARKHALQDARSAYNALKQSFESYVSFAGQQMENIREGGK
ncbi:hybrid sensor histidine kinase/response regulator [Anoxynatronum buryatiense]|uniref:Circadian input-output histidine kinase CikA n=1 Tax=Anoxynatronum buryatiense TaxID=489973 RepID=A0AA45WTN6_9CLOT|nr:PAS domain S-box protein [Anoxynatronum buryatiense]SMP43439.1 PAS/PAC sensor hybrid histidine kinase [Anoxynatronum buryatiense]